VFVIVIQLHPCVIFVGKAGAYPNKPPLKGKVVLLKKFVAGMNIAVL
jgi:hypothetical protein